MKRYKIGCFVCSAILVLCLFIALVLLFPTFTNSTSAVYQIHTVYAEAAAILLLLSLFALVGALIFVGLYLHHQVLIGANLEKRLEAFEAKRTENEVQPETAPAEKAPDCNPEPTPSEEAAPKEEPNESALIIADEAKPEAAPEEAPEKPAPEDNVSLSEPEPVQAAPEASPVESPEAPKEEEPVTPASEESGSAPETPAAPAPEAQSCPNCGAPLDLGPDDCFCPECGYRLKD
jgi:outer membrane biosynthesis protein TonB